MISQILGLFGIEFDPESKVKWFIDAATTICAILVGFGWLTQSSSDSFLGKIKSAGSSAVDWVKNKWNEWTDPDEKTMISGESARIEQVSSAFNNADTILGVPGLGAELKNICLELIKKGGEPAEIGKQAHDEMLGKIKEMWGNANPTKSPSEIDEKAERILYQVIGYDVNLEPPKKIESGLVGMLKQAREVKARESTLTEGEIAPLRFAAAPAQDWSPGVVR